MKAKVNRPVNSLTKGDSSMDLNSLKTRVYPYSLDELIHMEEGICMISDMISGEDIADDLRKWLEDCGLDYLI